MARAGSRETTEQRARHEAGTARIVEVVQAADHLAGAEQPGDARKRHVEHLPVGRIDAQAAERERDAAGCRIRLERRRIERLRPVRFRRIDAERSASVLYGVLERNVGAYGGVQRTQWYEEHILDDAFELTPTLPHSFHRLPRHH